MKARTQHLVGRLHRFWDGGLGQAILLGVAIVGLVAIGSQLTDGHAVRPALPPCERYTIVWSRDMPPALPIKIPAGGTLIGTDPGEWALVTDSCTISRADMHRASKGVAGRGRVFGGSGFDSRHPSPIIISPGDPIVTGG